MRNVDNTENLVLKQAAEIQQLYIKIERLSDELARKMRNDTKGPAAAPDAAYKDDS